VLLVRVLLVAMPALLVTLRIGILAALLLAGLLVLPSAALLAGAALLTAALRVVAGLLAGRLSRVAILVLSTRDGSLEVWEVSPAIKTSQGRWGSRRDQTFRYNNMKMHWNPASCPHFRRIAAG
jgi:hypothetical protein